MARPLRIEFEGAVYHVTARGNERKKIFFTKTDYEKFLSNLTEAKKKYNILLHSYVLMSNHYHLLIETPDANISRVMHYINSAYTVYINVKRKRSGHLFQGRYKSFVVDANSYMYELSRYIHLNPVRAKIVEKPVEYSYSSYPAYINKGKDQLVTTDFVLGIISNQKDRAREEYKVFVESARGIDIDNPMKNAYGGMIVGRVEFIKEILKNIKEDYYNKKEVSGRRALKAIYEKDEILAAVSTHFSLSPDDITKYEYSEARKIAVYLMKERTGLTNHEIGEVLGGLSCSGIAKAYQRFRQRLKGERKLRQRISKINKILFLVKG